jgi:hypothetical protein
MEQGGLQGGGSLKGLVRPRQGRRPSNAKSFYERAGHYPTPPPLQEIPDVATLQSLVSESIRQDCANRCDRWERGMDE